MFRNAGSICIEVFVEVWSDVGLTLLEALSSPVVAISLLHSLTLLPTLIPQLSWCLSVTFEATSRFPGTAASQKLVRRLRKYQSSAGYRGQTKIMLQSYVFIEWMDIPGMCQSCRILRQAAKCKIGWLAYGPPKLQSETKY